ncbi:hypothetical protein COW36_19745 [bacterium (Candidatus Blackallbacteria) CG17_big_fil_post_rev_8_21_14_2_50_48_46]|uniref:HTH cro/C1-type domain-containing protein n=1 Tax=bacterium (Candidatus Blackallbacteria) CG17_big_fil_post_rev_8_21_14_2_50_48_46 TaxID=2014261 RepID=A0A2M7FZP9_9BACT|nr:MAG: hypothetical protein COW64_15550 [bacterium (Candidatus Blackallbacteria) CG18_big_fil_WC_8_21_14_2_50_49_26]PIW14885.1 MAG: hypothetical protein COW36_19745 [bacterium (Candidatus Blackallbacteria) CG17_big_fil_post_rev_8_21_14_2_50_48_46]PIW44327.1 MAG: hypothetical protein COW20_24615 [bacterium (Candidatus Blackallbacteria) CG13_big_fil_rev_8_21_14_2_50_49_14]
MVEQSNELGPNLQSKIKASLGHKISRLRKKHKLSMKALADLTGVSPAYICRLESGERNPSREFVDRLAETLFKDGSQTEKDEFLISAGFAPAQYRQTNGNEDIISLYEKALNENPQQFKLFIGLVMVLIRTDRIEDAEKKIQEGIALFDNQIQLQSLFAALALAKKEYDTAIEYQSSALQYFKSQHFENDENIQLSDLLLSYGVMNFCKGEYFLDLKYTHEEKHPKKSKKYFETAMIALNQAIEIYQEALALVPEDVYILDEYARACFSMAYIQEDETLAHEFWQRCISGFQQVICSEDKHELGYANLLQSTSFLGYALTKSGRFPEAWFQLNLIESCAPHYWLIHYLKACHFCQKIQVENPGEPEREKYLIQALNSLQKAIESNDPSNKTLTEAPIDPDLKLLRTSKNPEFCGLMSKDYLRGSDES